jgi:hypothetical protein
MNIGILINTSPTMLQKTYRKVSLLECSKIGAEYLIQKRQRYNNQESKFDNYFLFCSNP